MNLAGLKQAEAAFLDHYPDGFDNPEVMSVVISIFETAKFRDFALALSVRVGLGRAADSKTGEMIADDDLPDLSPFAARSADHPHDLQGDRSVPRIDRSAILTDSYLGVL